MREAELGEIRDAARRNQVTVSAWVRRALREALGRQAIVPMTRAEAVTMRGVGWDGDVDEMRAGSPGDVL